VGDAPTPPKQEEGMRAIACQLVYQGLLVMEETGLDFTDPKKVLTFCINNMLPSITMDEVIKTMSKVLVKTKE